MDQGKLEERNLYIQTFGCQMNVHDSEQIAALLKGSGYSRTDNARNADLIIVNTCSIRRKAAEKAYSQLGRYQQLKKRNPHLILAMGGCLAQQWGAKIFTKLPHLDIVFGTHNIHRLPELIRSVENGDAPVVETAFQEEVHSIGILALPANGGVSAFVTIMQGCNNFCTYCVVPYLRGREQSRRSGEIIEEINTLADHGIREVILLGQNVNSYGQEGEIDCDFSTLIRQIASIQGIERIRFTTSHPKDLSDDLVGCFARVEKLCEHIHLPVQSGSDRILKRMKRGYTRADYLERIIKLRQACPQISITSDVIVGFPGEEEEDLADTLNLMEEVRFDGLFSFCYSEREGTAAQAFEDHLEDGAKRERLQRLQALQDRHTLERNKALEGRTVDVLVEGRSKNSACDVTGRTRSYKIVNFRGDPAAIAGRTVPVRITAAFLHSLRGDAQYKEEIS